jgi:hypothetical protein
MVRNAGILLAQGVPGFTPDTGIWAPIMQKPTNATAGLVLWMVGIFLLAGVIVFMLGRGGHNRLATNWGLFGCAIGLVGIVVFGAIKSGGVGNLGLALGDKLGAIVGSLIPDGPAAPTTGPR